MKTKMKQEYEAMSKAAQFMNSLRGQYIMGQALHIAHDQLVKTEPSNALDMRYLGENLYMMGWVAHELTHQEKK